MRCTMLDSTISFDVSNIKALYIVVEKLFWVKEQKCDEHYQLFTKKELNKMFGVQVKKGTLMCHVCDPDENYEYDTLYGFDAERKIPLDDVSLSLEFGIKNNLVQLLPRYVTQIILEQQLQHNNKYKQYDIPITMSEYLVRDLRRYVPISKKPIDIVSSLVLCNQHEQLICTQKQLKFYPF